jgi:hypothetical protein
VEVIGVPAVFVTPRIIKDGVVMTNPTPDVFYAFDAIGQ